MHKMYKMYVSVSSSLLDDRFELALGLNLYHLKAEVLISDRENDFGDILFD